MVLRENGDEDEQSASSAENQIPIFIKENGVYDPAETRKKLFFIYNNPDEQLLPFTRSRRVIEEPGITRINLTHRTPGHHRLDPHAGDDKRDFHHRLRARFGPGQGLGPLSPKEMARVGFADDLTIEQRLGVFAPFWRR